MTKEQATQKFEELINNLDFKAWAMERAERMLTSGYVNLEDYEDDYILPKAMVAAIGREIEWQYKPMVGFRRNGKKLVDALYAGI